LLGVAAEVERDDFVTLLLYAGANSLDTLPLAVLPTLERADVYFELLASDTGAFGLSPVPVFVLFAAKVRLLIRGTVEEPKLRGP